MSEHKIIYGRGRFPVQPEKGKCRGCHCDLPKSRRSWCSNECYEKYEPSRVRWHCKQRDKEICYLCGIDTERVRRRCENAHQYRSVSQYNYMLNGVFQREKYDLACVIFNRHRAKVQDACKKRIMAMNEAGWPYYSTRDWWEMDHIIPFSEGGITVLENVRTLCVLCHKKRTKHWHKTRKQKQEPEPFNT